MLYETHRSIYSTVNVLPDQMVYEQHEQMIKQLHDIYVHVSSVF